MLNINNKSSDETRNVKVYKDLSCVVYSYEDPVKTIFEIKDFLSDHFYRIVLKDGHTRVFTKPAINLKYIGINDRKVCPLTRKRFKDIMEGLGIN